MANAGTDWPFWLAAALLALGSVWLLWWSMLRDRSRGRRRCPRCWYDMSGVSGLRCPECGREARRERRLFRTRRRWGWAAIGVCLGLLAYAAYLAPRVRRDGLLRNVPTTALIVALPWLEEPPRAHQVWAMSRYPSATPPVASVSFRQQLAIDLLRRYREGGLSPRQQRGFWARLVAIDAARSREDPFAKWAFPMLLSPEPWVADEAALHASIAACAHRLIAIRAEWPRDRQLRYSVIEPVLRQLASDRERIVRIQPRIEGSSPIELHLSGGVPNSAQRAIERASCSSIVWNDSSFPFAALPEGRRTIEFDVSIEEDQTSLFRAIVRRNVVVYRPDSISMPSVGAPGADAALLESLRAVVVVCSTTGRSALIISLNSELLPGIDSELAGAAFSARIAIHSGGRSAIHNAFLVGEETPSTRVVWSDLSTNRAPAGDWKRRSADTFRADWIALPLNPQVQWLALGQAQGLALKISGDESLVWNDPFADRYWAGTIQLPVAVVMDGSPSDFDIRFKVGEYLLPGTEDPWAEAD